VCSVLQYVAVCCSVLQCVAAYVAQGGVATAAGSMRAASIEFCACCSVLQCVTVCCSVLQCVACVAVCCMCCSVLQCAVAHRRPNIELERLQFICERQVIAWCSVLQYVAMCCHVLQCVEAYRHPGRSDIGCRPSASSK